MLSALDMPDEPAILHGYGTIIGTGMQSWNGHQEIGGELMTAQPVKSLVVPAHPHPLLAPKTRVGVNCEAYDNAREIIEQTDADVLVIYSTLWPSIIGHQIQAHPNPEWVRLMRTSMT